MTARWSKTPPTADFDGCGVGDAMRHYVSLKYACRSAKRARAAVALCGATNLRGAFTFVAGPAPKRSNVTCKECRRLRAGDVEPCWSRVAPEADGFYWMRKHGEAVAVIIEAVHSVHVDRGPCTVYWGTHGGGWDLSALPDAEWQPVIAPREGGGACERMPPCACCGCQFSAHVIEGRIGECVALRLRSDVDSEDVCECDMYIIPDPELP